MHWLDRILAKTKNSEYWEFSHYPSDIIDQNISATAKEYRWSNDGVGLPGFPEQSLGLDLTYKVSPTRGLVRFCNTEMDYSPNSRFCGSIEQFLAIFNSDSMVKIPLIIVIPNPICVIEYICTFQRFYQ